MVFKRRDRRPIWQAVLDFLYPRGGWARAFEYVKHRVRRLPDTPEKISRGVWAGVFTSFTPFYGLHFLIAAVIAKLMRGNILAALMGTFFGNPLTYIPIAVAALQSGYLLTGVRTDVEGIGRNFARAFEDLRHNFMAIFTDDVAHWDYLASFYDDVFYPYMVGGVIPGVICATICYYLSVPLIGAYQNSRRKRLRAKLDQLRKPQDGDGPDLG
ncbi:DUF2062 domain-containing protein [Yoonia sp. R2331]|uniref:DUF2062 domain-containing protein n=1 Tax=Yoonia sp. R2331 TaxID=3237238 RepID=UPI0034E47BC0